MNQKITFFAVLFAAFAILIAQNFHRVNAEDAAPSPYKVVWDSPSTDWGGTMPLGNGEVAVNAWFDAAGRARLLFARTDSWDDYGALAKVGLVEIATLGETPDADSFTVIDTQANRAVDPASFKSKSRNMPFAGMRFAAWPALTAFKRKVVYKWQ